MDKQEKLKNYYKNYYHNNKQKYKEYYQKNKQKYKEYYKKNRQYRLKYQNEYNKNKKPISNLNRKKLLLKKQLDELQIKSNEFKNAISLS